MSPGLRTTTLGGILLLSITAFQSQTAIAFGQQWRSMSGHEPGPGGAHQRLAPAFRPATYGRSNLVARVDSGGRDSGRNRPVLPGWAATYRETNHAGSCLWCRGG